jgi:hypothetical protein
VSKTNRHTSDRVDAVKSIVISIVSLILVVIAGTGMIAFEAIAIWHLLREIAMK